MFITSTELGIAADRLQRMAHVADQAGAPELAGPLLQAARLVRVAAYGSISAAGREVAVEFVRVMRGDDDWKPLP